MEESVSFLVIVGSHIIPRFGRRTEKKHKTAVDDLLADACWEKEYFLVSSDICKY